MYRRTAMFAAIFAATFAAIALAAGLPLLAQDHPITVQDAYARANGAAGGAGAVFLTLQNTGPTDDRLLGVSTDAARMAELHSHSQTADGVMVMGRIEGGIALPAGGTHALARGGDHVMLMGLTRTLAQGDSLTVTLTFQTAGAITLAVPVDNAR